MPRFELPSLELPEISLPKLPDISLPELPDISLPDIPLPSLPELPKLPELPSLPKLPTLPTFKNVTPKEVLKPISDYVDSLNPLNQLGKIGEQDDRLETEAAAPFVAFVGAAVVLHALAYFGITYYLDGKKAEPESPLIDDARAVLTDASKEHKIQQGFDQFLFKIDSTGLSNKDAKARLAAWNQKITQYASRLEGINDPTERIKQTMMFSYWDYWHHYGRGFHKITDFLLPDSEKAKGNCVAQTKLAVALFDRLIDKLPENTGFGIQVFKNHVQPVLYERDDNGAITSVQSLISGEKLDKLVAPIFDPKILHVGYLKKQGVKSPVSFEDLLIAHPKPEDISKVDNPIQYFDRSDSTIVFPESDAIFDGDAPDDAIVSPPDYDQADETTPIEARSPNIRETATTTIGPEGAKVRVGLMRMPAALLDVELYPGEINFRTAIERDAFLSLSSLEEKQRFIKTLIRTSLKRAENSEIFVTSQKLFDDPYRNIPQSLDKLVSISAFQDKVRVAQHKLQILKRFFKISTDEFFSDGSAWHTLGHQKRLFANSVWQEPKDFILLLNTLNNSEDRATVHNFVMHGILSGDEGFSRPLLKMIADPTRVGFSSNAAEQAAFTPPQLKEALIAVTPGWDFPIDDNNDDEAEEVTAEPAAQIVISPETMIDIVFLFSRHPYSDDDGKLLAANPIALRWNSELSSAFTELNAVQSTQSQADWNADFVHLSRNWLRIRLEDRSFREKVYQEQPSFRTSSPSSWPLKKLVGHGYFPQHMEAILKDIVLRGTEVKFVPADSEPIENDPEILKQLDTELVPAESEASK